MIRKLWAWLTPLIAAEVRRAYRPCRGSTLRAQRAQEGSEQFQVLT